MDETGFREYLLKKRRSSSAVEQCVRFSLAFEEYLNQQQPRRTLDDADLQNLQEFLKSDNWRGASINSVLWGVGRYYEFTGNQQMRRAITSLRAERIRQKRSSQKSLRLNAIQGVNPGWLECLSAEGIRDVSALLSRCREPGSLAELAARTGIPPDDLHRLAGLASLTQIVDIKGVRVILLYESGYDSLEKIARADPADMQRKLAETNDRLHILRRHPTLVETTYWVRQAGELLNQSGSAKPG